MNLLSIDTTTKKASVSIKTNCNILTKEIENEITHSEKLLPLIDYLLKENNLKIENIDKYLVLNGPGSFTGIRISLATIKAFSQIFNKEIFSISSCEALAYLGYKASQKKYVLSIIDAKNDRVYFNLYKFNNINEKIQIFPLLTIQNEYIQDCINIINNFKEKNNITSQDIYVISNTRYENTYIDNISYPTTNDLIEIFENIYNLDNYTFNTFNLTANYARASQAERLKIVTSKK